MWSDYSLRDERADLHALECQYFHTSRSAHAKCERKAGHSKIETERLAASYRTSLWLRLTTRIHPVRVRQDIVSPTGGFRDRLKCIGVVSLICTFIPWRGIGRDFGRLRR